MIMWKKLKENAGSEKFHLAELSHIQYIGQECGSQVPGTWIMEWAKYQVPGSI